MRRNLLAAGSAMIGVWIIFKHFYPYADYFTDSYSYIQAAAGKDVIDYRPIGYSIFLRLVHLGSASETFFVTPRFMVGQTGPLWLYIAFVRGCGAARWWHRLVFVVPGCCPGIHHTR